MEEGKFIIGTYSKYEPWDRKHSRYVFEMNGNWYAVYELDDEMPFYVDREFNIEEYYRYKSKEAALLFVR